MVIKVVEKKYFSQILHSLKENKRLLEKCKITELSAQLDSEGILKEGGRLDTAKLPFDSKHPILIPEKHPTAKMLVLHYHREARHQGCHISHGTFRRAVYHIEHFNHEANDILLSIGKRISFSQR